MNGCARSLGAVALAVGLALAATGGSLAGADEPPEPPPPPGGEGGPAPSPSPAEPANPPPSASSLSVFGGVRLRFTGYLDIGFFDAAGDGVAYVRDVGKKLHPEETDVPWVFLGDPWSNPVNSQGDSADLGRDRTTIPRFDPIASGGKPSFLVNMVNLGMVGGAGEKLLFEFSVDFEPRSGTLGSSGDQIDIDLAYLEWMPWKSRDIHVFAGKFESTFGIEYRRRKAPDRPGITPSLIARYTTGTPTGLKLRGSLLHQKVTYNLGLTNGTVTTEKFAHFFDELDTNAGKTVSGRISFQLPLPFTLEVGASGLSGAQDLQPSARDRYNQYGVDLQLVAHDLTVRAELLRATADGGGVTRAPSLNARGGFVEAFYQLWPWAEVLGRADFRKARLLTYPNLYLSDTARATVGARFDISPNAIGKVEYLHIMERTGPELDDDVATVSFVFKF